MIPIIALGLPIFDTLLSVARRYFARQPIFNADRGHIHHRLLDVGFTHKRAVVTLYGVTVVLAALAIVATLDRAWSSGLAVLGASAMLFGLVRFVSQFDRYQGRSAPGLREPMTERLRVAVPPLLVALAEVPNLAALELLVQRELEKLECCAMKVTRDGNSILSIAIPAATALEPTRDVTEVFSAPDSAFEVHIHPRSNQPLSPDSRLLLQLVADAVTSTLRRVS